MRDFGGRFFDGSSSAPDAVSVALAEGGLAIAAPGGARLWPYRELRLVEEAYDGRPARLRALSGGEARLVVDDAAFLPALIAKARHLRRRNRRGRRLEPRAAGWTAGVAAAIAAIYFGLPIAAGPLAAIIPLAWEEALGETTRTTLLDQLGSGTRICDAPDGKAALERLVARLAATMPSRYTWRVEVADTKELNAVNLPGGYILLLRGLVDDAKSPEELSGVLAHEMGHGISRHTTRGLIGNVVVQALLTVFAGDSARWAGTAADVALRSHSREAEREADRLGVEMLNRAGIRAAPFAGWFRRLAAEEKTAANKYVSTHPPSLDRAADVEARGTGKGDAMSAEDWKALRAICTK
jgi:beta-barrel assembly-enhancing protease